MVTSLVVLNLAGGECVEDLRLLEKDEGLGRVLRLAETQGLGRRVSEPSRPAPKAAKTGPSRAPWLDCAQRQPERPVPTPLASENYPQAAMPNP